MNEIRERGSDSAQRGGGWGFRLFIIGCVAVLLALPLWRSKKTEASPAPPVEAAAETPAAVEEPAAGAAPAQVEPVMVARAEAPSAVEQQWGIQVAGAQLTLGGRAVDLRYKVVDSEKAQALAAGTTSVYAVDEQTGTRLALPTLPETGRIPMAARARLARQVGTFPPSPNALGLDRTNSVLLPNALMNVKSGSRLTVYVGDARAEHVVVQ